MIPFEKKQGKEDSKLLDVLDCALNISATDFNSAETVIDQFALHYGKDFKLKFHVTLAQV